MENNNELYDYLAKCFNDLIENVKQRYISETEKIEQKKQINECVKNSQKSIQDSINNVNDVIQYDLTTDEGYSKYMEYLGKLRNKFDSGNDPSANAFLKLICGQTATEILDEIAQKATDVHEEAKKQREKPLTEKCTNEKICEWKNNDNTLDKCEKDCNCDKTTEPEKYVNPSERIPYSTYENICTIVDRYFDTELIPNNEDLDENDLDFIYGEIIEFASWLKQQ